MTEVEAMMLGYDLPTIAELAQRPAWHAEARCHRQVALMYDKARVEVAKALCRRCPVVGECLTAAYAEGDVWSVRGALTAEERRALVRPAA